MHINICKNIFILIPSTYMLSKWDPAHIWQYLHHSLCSLWLFSRTSLGFWHSLQQTVIPHFSRLSCWIESYANVRTSRYHLKQRLSFFLWYPLLRSSERFRQLHLAQGQERHWLSLGHAGANGKDRLQVGPRHHVIFVESGKFWRLFCIH